MKPPHFGGIVLGRPRANKLAESATNCASFNANGRQLSYTLPVLIARPYATWRQHNLVKVLTVSEYCVLGKGKHELVHL